MNDHDSNFIQAPSANHPANDKGERIEFRDATPPAVKPDFIRWLDGEID